MREITIEELRDKIADGVRCALQVRHAERPKMDPDDPTFGDALPLTAEGERTAKELGRRLAALKDEVTFWSSPLRRTQMTALAIAEGMGVSLSAVPTDERLGNGSFYYADPMTVLEVFKNDEFFTACAAYYRAGEYRGFKNLYEATDEYERWLVERQEKKLLVVTTHDCYIAAYLAARGACEEGFTRDNWPRFLDGGATFFNPDGSREYVLVRTGLSDKICGVKV